MIAYHFPPIRGSSGLLRTLSFTRYLPDHQWQPIVLAPHVRAYPTKGPDAREGIPDDVVLYRAFSLDTRRHLSIRGAHLLWLAMPDPWISWWLGAVPTGLRLIRRFRPKAIWSTYPVATAHLIGLTLHQLTGVPWVADFRDPMLYESWPTVPTIRRLHAWIERTVVTRSQRSVLTTPGTLRLYTERYPERPASHWVLLPNGYDEKDFVGLEPRVSQESDAGKPLVLVHSGLMEPEDRDPTNLFLALTRLKDAGRIAPADLRIILRATGYDEQYRPKIDHLGISEIVCLAPHIPYREALQEMLDADGLLIFQGPTCNRQIPAKLYEALRARRPLFVITDPEGDTAKAVQQIGVEGVVRYDSVDEIAEKLDAFVRRIRDGRAPVPSAAAVKPYSREARAAELAAVLDSVAEAR